MKKKDTFKYELKKGNKVVYAGITNDLDRRNDEHSKDKDYDKMVKVGNKTDRESAEKWETERLETYKKNHNGSLPDLNKTSNGK